MEQDTAELFTRYGDMIYRIAMSYGNSVQFAEDMVQEVFVRYLKKRPAFENREHEKAWFIRVAVNCCKSTLSSAWFRHVCPLEETGQTAVPFGDEESCVLYELLCTLPAKYRIVLYLRYYEEYKVVLVYKCGQKKLNNLYYQVKEQRRCSKWQKTKNLTLWNLNSRSWICTMQEEPRIHNWSVNMA